MFEFSLFSDGPHLNSKVVLFKAWDHYLKQFMIGNIDLMTTPPHSQWILFFTSLTWASTDSKALAPLSERASKRWIFHASSPLLWSKATLEFMLLSPRWDMCHVLSSGFVKQQKSSFYRYESFIWKFSSMNIVWTAFETSWTTAWQLGSRRK